MPFIRITVVGAMLDPGQVSNLERGVTDLMTSVMHKPIQGTAVLIDQPAAASISIAKQRVDLAAHVEVVIGEHTNTTSEKAEFASEMMKLLRRVLGPNLPNETYVVLHEINRESYGRGGITRAERDRLAGQQ